MEPIRRLVSILAPILIAVPPTVTPAVESKAASTGLLDKTLVAWICPANLTQRGGEWRWGRVGVRVLLLP